MTTSLPRPGAAWPPLLNSLPHQSAAHLSPKFPSFFLHLSKGVKFVFTYLKTERASLCWLTHQIPTIARAGPGCSQEPRISSHVVTGTQRGVRHLHLPDSRPQGGGLEQRRQDVNQKFHYYAGVLGGIVTDVPKPALQSFYWALHSLCSPVPHPSIHAFTHRLSSPSSIHISFIHLTRIKINPRARTLESQRCIACNWR